MPPNGWRRDLYYTIPHVGSFQFNSRDLPRRMLQVEKKSRSLFATLSETRPDQEFVCRSMHALTLICICEMRVCRCCIIQPIAVAALVNACRKHWSWFLCSHGIEQLLAWCVCASIFSLKLLFHSSNLLNLVCMCITSFPWRPQQQIASGTFINYFFSPQTC